MAAILVLLLIALVALVFVVVAARFADQFLACTSWEMEGTFFEGSSSIAREEGRVPAAAAAACHVPSAPAAAAAAAGSHSGYPSRGSSSPKKSGRVGKGRPQPPAGSLEELQQLLKKGWGGHVSRVLPAKFSMMSSIEERYEVGLEIGRGGFGRVRRARDRRSGEQVAIKEVDKERITAAGVSLRCLRMEIRAMLLLRGHENVVQLRAVHEDKQRLFIVTELCWGSLHDLVNYSGILLTATKQKKLALFSGVLSALHAAHDLGLVHCDVKNDNIMAKVTPPQGPGVGPRIVLKLADWGASMQLLSPGGSTQRRPMGTPGFMAPEMLAALNRRNRGAAIGQGVDMYAAGVTLMKFLGCYEHDLSPGARRLVRGLMHPEEKHRLTAAAAVQQMAAVVQ